MYKALRSCLDQIFENKIQGLSLKDSFVPRGGFAGGLAKIKDGTQPKQ